MQKLIIQNNMKIKDKTYIIIAFSIGFFVEVAFILAFVLQDCFNDNTYIYPQPVINDTICTNQYYSESVKDTNNNTTNYKIEDANTSQKDSSAIGNIEFGINTTEFEKQKKVFLTEHQTLGGLKIVNIKGFYYNKELAGVQIVSESNRHKDYENWKGMYSKKYEMDYRYGRFENNYKYIYVTDYNANNSLAKSYEELIEYKFIAIPAKPVGEYQSNFYNNIFAQAAAEQVLEALDNKSILEKYRKEIQDANTKRGNELVDYKYSIAIKYYKKYYDKAKENSIRFYKIHENDPSYSIIIILSKKNLKEYYEHLNRIKEQNVEKTKKEIDII